MRILLWHVHAARTTSFVRGGHTHLLPVPPDRGPDGLGRARTHAWPNSFPRDRDLLLDEARW